MSKIDIDVLVQLLVQGPQGAQHWAALKQDPDALGTQLWQQNYGAAPSRDEAPPLPTYHFEPLPFAVTAEEGLKHCACYTYQTMIDGELPAGAVRDLIE